MIQLFGRNYQNLKATDDLFKGGMEQDDGDDDIPIASLAVENNLNKVENNLEKFKVCQLINYIKYIIKKKLCNLI